MYRQRSVSPRSTDRRPKVLSDGTGTVQHEAVYGVEFGVKVWRRTVPCRAVPCRIRYERTSRPRPQQHVEVMRTFKMLKQEGLAVASIVRDDPSRLPGMHRDHNALPSQTDGQTDRRTLTS